MGGQYARSVALALLAAAALALSGCGRAGPLELPPGPASVSAPPPAAAPPSTNLAGAEPSSATPQDAAAKNGFDRKGNPVAPTGERKPFFLDFLLQ